MNDETVDKEDKNVDDDKTTGFHSSSESTNDEDRKENADMDDEGATDTQKKVIADKEEVCHSQVASCSGKISTKRC